MAQALREGRLGVMDYFNLKNIEADTSMRESLGGEDRTTDDNAPDMEA